MFSENAPSANPVFFRTYSRRTELGHRETWDQVCDRTIRGTAEIGKLTPEEVELIDKYQRELKTLSSGRWLWVGGVKWIEDPLNVYGGYNCSGTAVVDWEAFGLLMNLAMTGCGTGASLEEKFINQLPPIRNRLTVEVKQEIGAIAPDSRLDMTAIVYRASDVVDIIVGDSRQGWVDAYEALLKLSSDEMLSNDIVVGIYLGNVRKTGEKLKSFGGTANPIKLTDLWGKLARILNGAIGRRLTYEECCLVIDEAAAVVVAGNIRRSAGIKQFDKNAKLLKTNLWQQDEQGNWFIDPERDALRMSNHTRVYHQKPTREECIDAVRSQYYSGEGAIQWAGEAVARANADLLDGDRKRSIFLDLYDRDKFAAKTFLEGLFFEVNKRYPQRNELSHRFTRYLTNPCGEIIGINFMCDLSEVHLNNIDPHDFEEQQKAFEAGALNVAALLHQKFPDERYQYSRIIDPIVAVCPTGVFDFFVKLFGVDWLKWWEAGRPAKWGHLVYPDGELFAPNPKSKWYGNTAIAPLLQSFYFKQEEQKYLSRWSKIVHDKVWEYCDRHNLKHPNRCTSVQPSGTKSLLTGASSGWHPPKAQRFIRRITFGKNDPVALACIDYGYNVVPSQSDKDENGNLLNDPYSPLCTEWLVEIPTEVSWANLPGADQIDISKFSALAQFDFYMQVQKFYTRHNCFSGDTEFFTSHGIKKFADFQPGDIVQVLNKNGVWSDAEIVKTQDKRDLYKITIIQGSTKKKKEIIATSCHRFPVRRSSGGICKTSIKTTVELKPGIRLVTNSERYPVLLDRRGIQNGIVYGDGCLAHQGKVSQVYLCNEKRELKIYFDKEGNERDDLGQTQFHWLNADLKSIPSGDCTQEYLAGFIAGLIATDGHISNSTISISSSDPVLVEFLKLQLPRLGILITGEHLYVSGGYAGSKPNYQIRLSKETISHHLILRESHKNAFFSTESYPKQWRVVSVEKLEQQDYAWCVMEKETNHFTLADNILVMNTSGTLEIREHEVEEVGERIYQAIQEDEGYISIALLSRFDDKETYPRLPFEPIDKETYERLSQEVLQRRKTDDFCEAMAHYDLGEIDQAGPAGCDSDKCMFPLEK